MYMKPKNINIYEPPTTILKKEITEISLPNSLRFLADVKVEFDSKDPKETPFVKGSWLYQKYLNWCSPAQNNEATWSILSNVKFVRAIVRKGSGIGIDKQEKINGYMMYDLSTIRMQ